MSDFFKKYSEIRGEDHIQNLKAEGRIAAQIKTKRKSLNMSQQDLADSVGIPKSTIGRIEAGITNPKVNTLLQISKALDTTFIIDGTMDSNNPNLYVEI